MPLCQRRSFDLVDKRQRVRDEARRATGQLLHFIIRATYHSRTFMCASSRSPVAHVPLPKTVLGQHMVAPLFFTRIQIQVLMSAVFFYMLTAF